MRICNKCHRTFDDTAFFCPDCGEALVDQPIEASHRNSATISSPGVKSKSATEVLKESARKKTEEWDNSDNVVVKWLPSLISVIGLLVAWNFSVLFGLVLSICGIIYGSTTKNKMNKIVSLTVGIICALLCVMYMFS